VTVVAARLDVPASAVATRDGVALVHDYLTQRGGAERVVLLMMEAFPHAPLHTSLLSADGTFPELAAHRVATALVNRVPAFRTHHRAAFPFLAPTFSTMHVEAPVTLCSSSGWAHGVRVSGRKVVYCHSPARWLYRADQYLHERRGVQAVGLRLLRRPLLDWDQRAAASADRYVANSTLVRDSIRSLYGRDAEVVHPPTSLDTSGPQEAIPALDPGYFLCVSRLLPYKNVDVVMESMDEGRRLVVVGEGPEADRLEARAGDRVVFLGRVTDAQLRWLYANSAALVSASYEDFGITTIEAASFGIPAIALRYGGFLDTVVEDETGVLFDAPLPSAVRAAIERFEHTVWDRDRIAAHGASFSPEAFKARLCSIVADEARLA